LIIAYRDRYADYPLLPWLHSTEPCEHFFGVIRQLKKDFSYADLLHLEPKIRTLLLGDFGNLTVKEKANQTSSSYHHTYFKTDDLDQAALLRYPSDKDIATASASAFAEIEQLCLQVGIDARRMLQLYEPPAPAPAKIKAPATSSSREPQTLLEILALYRDASFKWSKDEDEFESVELGLVAESVEKSLLMCVILFDVELYSNDLL
jgi:hypothetical protein